MKLKDAESINKLIKEVHAAGSVSADDFIDLALIVRDAILAQAVTGQSRQVQPEPGKVITNTVEFRGVQITPSKNNEP